MLVAVQAEIMVHAVYVHDQRPLRIYWEVTRSCDLACRHCRATAVPVADPDELTDTEALELIARLAEFGDPLPHLVFTGGDPLKRSGLFALIAAARRAGFRVSVAPSATPLLTRRALIRLHDAGIDAISLSLDGSTDLRHDGIRGVEDTFQRTLTAAAVAAEIGLPFQVNTVVSGNTIDELPAIHERVRSMRASRWSLFFLVTVGRGRLLQPISAEQAEAVLHWAAALASAHQPGDPIVTTTEAPQMRRVALQRRAESGAPKPHPHAQHGTHAAGIRDGNGVMFISHTGDVSPSGFLELPLGNVRHDHPVEIYRHAPLFQDLRQPDHFDGRCGVCEFQGVCGGSRARAYAATGNPLAEDPLCTYVPIVMNRHSHGGSEA
jgi:radical SAM protein